MVSDHTIIVGGAGSELDCFPVLAPDIKSKEGAVSSYSLQLVLIAP